MNARRHLLRIATTLPILMLSLLMLWLPFVPAGGIAHADDGLCQPGNCLPDLRLLSNDYTSVNGQAYAVFTIVNSGEGRADAFHVELRGPNGDVRQIFTIAGLGPNMRTNLLYPIAGRCSYSGFTLMIDSTYAVHETNENNNLVVNISKSCPPIG
jgi:hypothetical protein